MDTFLSIVPIKNTVLPEISGKGAGKAFLVKIENKILLQALKIL